MIEQALNIYSSLKLFDQVLIGIAMGQLVIQLLALVTHSYKGKKMRINNAFYIPYLLILIVLFRYAG